MHRQDRLIASCKSWSDFWERTKELPTDAEKGAALERLTQLYLQTTPEYLTELKHVWLLRDVPPAVRRRLDLPPLDEGIDLIACTRRGEYWAIQSKFRSASDHPLTRRELGTFTSLAFNTCRNIALAVVAHTSSKPVSKRHLMRNTTEIGLDRWQALDRDAWGLIVAKLHGKAQKPKPRRPLPHQAEAVAKAEEHFVRDGAARGRLIMPCGTGKSLTAYWIAKTLGAQLILVAVPSLALVRQSLKDWTREYLANGIKPDWLCVCSDELVGDLEKDEFVGEVYDLGVPAHTDIDEIAAFLRAGSQGTPKVVFTTYHSSANLAAAARKARISFDLAILDEAHKTVTKPSKPFATLLDEKKISVRRRLFMTATERVPRSDSQDVLSMNRESEYGKRFFQLSFKEAIQQGIIADYKILTLTVNDHRIRVLIDENRILDVNSRDLDEAEAQSLAAGIALKRVYAKHEIKHAISFHRSILAANGFREQQDALNECRALGPQVRNFHISSKKTAGQRTQLLDEFVAAKRALMTNARCLTEGVDVPAIDCVMFADPKRSRIDIVQAAGRALRKRRGEEKCAYIVVPVIVPNDTDFNSFAETTAFRQVAQIITALSTQDERIAEEFRLIEAGRKSKGTIVEIDGDVAIGMKMKLSDFAEAISTRVWESVGRANWRPFDEAVKFVHELKLKKAADWRAYRRGERKDLPSKPHDIPGDPQDTYGEEFRQKGGWGAWLGTGTISTHLRTYRPYDEAVKFVRKLGLNSGTEYAAYCSGERKDLPPKPHDVPAYPDQTYGEEFRKKGGWGGWLGTGTVATRSRKYRPYDDAIKFVHTLKLTSFNEWRPYCRGERKDLPPKPNDIPQKPSRTYGEEFRQKGGWGAWLGTYTIATKQRKYRSYDDAVKFVHTLKLNNRDPDWLAYVRGERNDLPSKPDDIPSNPNVVYDEFQEQGGWGAWLGTGAVANQKRIFSTYDEAVKFVHPLKLNNQRDWQAYSGGKRKDLPPRPHNIPSDPYGHYGEEFRQKGGWRGWVGTESVSSRQRLEESVPAELQIEIPD